MDEMTTKRDQLLREDIARRLQPAQRVAFEARRFVECATCAAKPGSPDLCASCLANRHTLDELHAEIAALYETAKLLADTVDSRRPVTARWSGDPGPSDFKRRGRR